MTTTTWWTLMGTGTSEDSDVTQSSFGHRQQLDWFLIRRQPSCILQSSQDLRVLQKRPFTVIQNREPESAHQTQLAFSSDHKLVWSTYLPTHLISTVQWRPLALVAETGRGSAPQQQLHQYLMSTTRCLMKSRVPLEVSYIHQCITLHTYTHTYFGVYLLLLTSYFDMNPNSILTKAEPSNSPLKFWGPDQMSSLWWLNVYLVLISCVCASVLVHAT